MPTQLRDSRGRFVKEPDWDEIVKIQPSSWGHSFTPEELGEAPKEWTGANSVQIYEHDPRHPLGDEEDLKIARSVRLAIWWSENWGDVVGYIAYAVICFSLGLLGGYIGVVIGLR